jgi:hypothetical protein
MPRVTIEFGGALIHCAPSQVRSVIAQLGLGTAQQIPVSCTTNDLLVHASRAAKSCLSRFVNELPLVGAASRSFSTALRTASVRKLLEGVLVRDTRLLRILQWVSSAADASRHLTSGVIDDALHEVDLIFRSISTGHEEDTVTPSLDKLATVPPIEADYDTLSHLIESEANSETMLSRNAAVPDSARCSSGMHAAVGNIKLQHMSSQGVSEPPAYNLAASIPSLPIMGKGRGTKANGGSNSGVNTTPSEDDSIVRDVPIVDKDDDGLVGPCTPDPINQNTMTEADNWRATLCKFGPQIVRLEQNYHSMHNAFEKTSVVAPAVGDRHTIEEFLAAQPELWEPGGLMMR